MAKNIYTDINLKQNQLKKTVIERVDDFFDGAVKGQIIYHTGFESFFVCKNPDITGGTSQKGAWGIGQVDAETELFHSGEPRKVLVSQPDGSFKLEDVDGGEM